MIEFKNVAKRYEEKDSYFYALNNINLTLLDGKCYGIVGYSGAGKSTLIRLINGLIHPSQGEVIVDDKDVSKMSAFELQSLRINMGMVFQHFNLLASKTVYQNIVEALKIAKFPKEKREEKVLELLRQVDLLDKRDKYPKSLSGGEKQRVGIARALANDPKYLLCDEATSALDSKNASEIIDLLLRIKKERQITIIFISHQLEIIKNISDRIIVLENGSVVEENDTLEIFINPKAEATKSLIKPIISDLILPNKEIYQLIYYRQNSDEAILSNLIKNYDVEINILNAKEIVVNEKMVGYLYVEIKGADKDKAIKILQSKGLEVNQYAGN